MEILKCDCIGKVYGSGANQVRALDKVNLSVEKGEFVAIIGASGSGKSTLLHILGSVEKPTKGKVLVDGIDISSRAGHRQQFFAAGRLGWFISSIT